MRDLANLIAKNAEAAGREFAHAELDGDVDRANRIATAHWDSLESRCAADGVNLVADSPAADIEFLAFNRGVRAGKQEG